MKVRERIGNFAWRLLLPLFRLKWWIRDRDIRKEFRRHQEWEYMLHSWKTCAFVFWFEDLEREPTYIAGCTYRSRFWRIRNRRRWKGNVFLDSFPICKKSLCKNYVHDPIKDGEPR